jgi:hypothetical protein
MLGTSGVAFGYADHHHFDARSEDMNAATLNGRARAILSTKGVDRDDPENAAEIIDACRSVATDAGYRLRSRHHPDFVGTTDCDQIEQYVDRRGNTVNLWIIDVQGVGFADGGLGFED